MANHNPSRGPQANRDEQLENLHNITTTQDFYPKLGTGHTTPALTSPPSHSPTPNPQIHYIPVPLPLKAQLGSPTALAIGAFATTLTTLSFALMGLRGLATTNAFVGNFFAVAGVGMVVSAQWELVLGNTYAYTVLSAFGLFYFGFGVILTPLFGVADAYGGTESSEYNNALGFFVLMWAVFNVFFLIGSAPLNLVYFGIFLTVQLAFTLVSAAYFLTADGWRETAAAVNTAAGAFALVSGMLGYYTVANLMCKEALGVSFPMGDTSRFFGRRGKGA